MVDLNDRVRKRTRASNVRCSAPESIFGVRNALDLFPSFICSSYSLWFVELPQCSLLFFLSLITFFSSFIFAVINHNFCFLLSMCSGKSLR